MKNAITNIFLGLIVIFLGAITMKLYQADKSSGKIDPTAGNFQNFEVQSSNSDLVVFDKATGNIYAYPTSLEAIASIFGGNTKIPEKYPAMMTVHLSPTGGDPITIKMLSDTNQ